MQKSTVCIYDLDMAKKAGRKLPACFKQGMGESGLPKMNFRGQVFYCSREDDCNFICSKLRAENVAVVGFDMEWKVTFSKDMRKTALIQLCPSQDTCYLFHIVMMNGFPTELRLLIESDVTMKVGVGIHCDMQKLKKDFDIEAKGYLDLSDIANKKLKCNEKWSLNGLTMHLFKSRIGKYTKVRCSDWENFPLSQTQEQYAANDVYISYAIYCKLTELA